MPPFQPGTQSPIQGELIVESGLLQGHRIPLDQLGLKILAGRDPECTLAFPSERKMSRKHALIEVRSDGVFLQDLNSVNRTFLNAQRVEGTVPVPSGASIRLGDDGPSLRIVWQWTRPAPRPLLVPSHSHGAGEVTIVGGGGMLPQWGQVQSSVNLAAPAPPTSVMQPPPMASAPMGIPPVGQGGPGGPGQHNPLIAPPPGGRIRVQGTGPGDMSPQPQAQTQVMWRQSFTEGGSSQLSSPPSGFSTLNSGAETTRLRPIAIPGEDRRAFDLPPPSASPASRPGRSQLDPSDWHGPAAPQAAQASAEHASPYSFPVPQPVIKTVPMPPLPSLAPPSVPPAPAIPAEVVSPRPVTPTDDSLPASEVPRKDSALSGSWRWLEQRSGVSTQFALITLMMAVAGLIGAAAGLYSTPESIDYAGLIKAQAEQNEP